MDIGLLLAFFVVLLVSFLFLRKRQNLPPSRFTIPYIGTLGFLWSLRGRRPHEAFVEEVKELGSVFSFSIANRLFVVLNGYDAIHEALVKNADSCSGRLDDIRKMLKVETKEEGIVFCEYGQSWKEQRRFTLQALRDFGVGKTSLEENIATEIDALTAYLRGKNGKPLSFIRPVQKLVANIIFGIVFGRRYCYSYEFDDPEFDSVLQMTNDIVRAEGFLNLTLFLPECIISRIKSKNDELVEKRRLADELHKYITDQIDEHESTFDNNNIRDFVDFYWRTVKYGDDIDKKYLTKKNMFRIISDLFLAGSETSSVSLDWAMLYMTEFPDVQKKCQDEIESVVGHRAITYGDRNNLPYTHATILEVLRLTTIAPLSVPHLTTQDTKIYGYDVPKNTVLFANVYSACIDPIHWEKPQDFIPDRFITTNGKHRKTDAFLPFSAGPRACLGEPLARMELFLVFSNLLQRFTFCRESDDVRHPLESIVGRMSNMPMEYKLRAVSRL